jgi:hypothetical protein
MFPECSLQVGVVGPSAFSNFTTGVALGSVALAVTLVSHVRQKLETLKKLEHVCRSI